MQLVVVGDVTERVEALLLDIYHPLSIRGLAGRLEVGDDAALARTLLHRCLLERAQARRHHVLLAARHLLAMHLEHDFALEMSQLRPSVGAALGRGQTHL